MGQRLKERVWWTAKGRLLSNNAPRCAELARINLESDDVKLYNKRQKRLELKTPMRYKQKELT